MDFVPCTDEINWEYNIQDTDNTRGVANPSHVHS